MSMVRGPSLKGSILDDSTKSRRGSSPRLGRTIPLVSRTRLLRQAERQRTANPSHPGSIPGGASGRHLVLTGDGTHQRKNRKGVATTQPLSAFPFRNVARQIGPPPFPSP